MEIKTKFPPEFFKEEAKTIVVSPETKRLWAVLLDLLLEFDRVCRKNGIKYMIDGGTLIGAARHGGFIPWDDDIDVIMLREEYEKLNKIATKEFAAPYFWQTNETDPDHGRGYAKLRNSSTTYITYYDILGGKKVFHHNQGVPIDVFICDNVPDRAEERTPFLKCVELLRKRAWTLRKNGHIPWSPRLIFSFPELRRKIEYLMLAAFSRENILQKQVRRLNAEVQRYDGEITEYVSHLVFGAAEGTRRCYIFPRQFMEDLTEIKFEGYNFLAPTHWDEYLSGYYGDWRKHVVGTSSHGRVFVDLDKPYTEYLE